MAWIYLFIGGVFEIVATTLFRYTDGMTKFLPTIALITTFIISLIFLQRSLTDIPLGTAYAVWTGIGAAGTALIGIFYYGEPTNMLRLVFLTVLVGSIVCLKFVGGE